MALDHGRFLRIPVRGLLAALSLCGLSLSASAFMTPSPPPGFGGGPGSWTFSPPSPAEQLGKIIRGPGPRLPGGASVGGAFRLGGGAARALAGGLARGLIPGVGLALGIAWLASNCFEQQGGSWVRTCGPGVDDIPISDGSEFTVNQSGVSVGYYPTAEAACRAWMDAYNADPSKTYTLTFTGVSGARCNGASKNRQTGANGTTSTPYSTRPASQCPVGWYITPAGCVQDRPPLPTVTPEQIEEEMAPKPLPQQLPPGFPYPLDPTSPFIFNPTPGDNPQAQPLRVPQGAPRPVPNTDPQQYKQPVIRYVPAPTPDEPTRVDPQPEDVTSTDPEGIKTPQTVEDGQGDDGKEPDKFDLCKEHPDILACAKPDLDSPDGEIPKETQNVSFQEENLFGSGACPADVSMSFRTLGGTSAKIIGWQQFCDWAVPLRGLVVALAALTAAFILMPGGIRE